MKRLTLFTLFILIAHILFSQNNINSSKYINRFHENEGKFNDIIEALKVDTMLKKHNRLVYKPRDFKNEILVRLKELGVDEIIPFYWADKLQFHFEMNWGKSFLIKLNYNTLDSVMTHKNFYRKDKYHNENWGLGNYWAIVIERKVTPTKR